MKKLLLLYSVALFIKTPIYSVFDKVRVMKTEVGTVADALEQVKTGQLVPEAASRYLQIALKKKIERGEKLTKLEESVYGLPYEIIEEEAFRQCYKRVVINTKVEAVESNKEQLKEQIKACYQAAMMPLFMLIAEELHRNKKERGPLNYLIIEPEREVHSTTQLPIYALPLVTPSEENEKN